MLRIAFCTLALFGFGAAARAGELDKEAAPKTTQPAATGATAPAAMPAGTELDKESPQAAYHYHGGWGGHRGWYGGFGGYRGFYRPYYGGFGGYRSFYRPYYGGFYRPYYRAGFYGGYSPYFYSYGISPFGWYNYAW
jgi:hypothetical protein